MVSEQLMSKEALSVDDWQPSKSESMIAPQSADPSRIRQQNLKEQKHSTNLQHWQQQGW